MLAKTWYCRCCFCALGTSCLIKSVLVCCGDSRSMRAGSCRWSIHLIVWTEINVTNKTIKIKSGNLTPRRLDVRRFAGLFLAVDCVFVVDLVLRVVCFFCANQIISSSPGSIMVWRSKVKLTRQLLLRECH